MSNCPSCKAKDDTIGELERALERVAERRHLRHYLHGGKFLQCGDGECLEVRTILATHGTGELARLRKALRTSAYSYHVRDHNHLGVDFEKCTLYQCVETLVALGEKEEVQ